MFRHQWCSNETPVATPNTRQHPSRSGHLPGPTGLLRDTFTIQDWTSRHGTRHTSEDRRRITRRPIPGPASATHIQTFLRCRRVTLFTPRATRRRARSTCRRRPEVRYRRRSWRRRRRRRFSATTLPWWWTSTCSTSTTGATGSSPHPRPTTPTSWRPSPGAFPNLKTLGTIPTFLPKAITLTTHRTLQAASRPHQDPTTRQGRGYPI